MILVPIFIGKIPIVMEVDVSLVVLALQEVSVGFVLGFISFLFEGILRTIGSFLSQVMGLQMAQITSPGTVHSPIISEVCYLLGVMVLLSVDGHHYFLQAICLSFEVIPIGSFSWKPELFELMFTEWRTLVRFVILLSAPFLLLFFSVITELGILGRMVPQMNIFLMEYPMRLGSCIVIMAWFMPSFLQGFLYIFLIVKDTLNTLLI